MEFARPSRLTRITPNPYHRATSNINLSKTKRPEGDQDAPELGPEQGFEQSFEQSLRELEQIVHELEEGGLGLADSLSRYEQGVQHLRRCYQALKQAEQKIEQLSGVDAQGNAVTEPFDDRAPAVAEETAKETAAAREAAAPGESAGSGRQKPPKSPAPTRKRPPLDDVDGPPSLF